MLQKLHELVGGRVDPEFNQIVLAQDNECQYLFKEEGGRHLISVWAFKNKPGQRNWWQKKFGDSILDGSVVVNYDPPREHNHNADFGVLLDFEPSSVVDGVNETAGLLDAIWREITRMHLMPERARIR